MNYKTLGQLRVCENWNVVDETSILCCEFLEIILISLRTQCECSYLRCPTDGFNCQVASTRH